MGSSIFGHHQQDERREDIVQGSLALSTGDNLNMTFDAAGNITALADGVSPVTLQAGGGYGIKDFLATNQNLLLNPDFETGTFANWSGVTGTATVESEAGPNFFCRLVHAGTSASVQQLVNLPYGRLYIIRCRYRTSATGTPLINIIPQGGGTFYNGNGVPITQIQMNPALNVSTWTEISTMFYVDNTVTGVIVQPRAFNVGTLEVDNFELETIDEAATAMTQTATALNPTTVQLNGTGQNIDVVSTVTEGADHFAVSGSITNTSGSDRAVAMDFTLPIDPAGTTWWDSMDEERVFVAGNTFVTHGYRLASGRDETEIAIGINPAAAVDVGGNIGVSIAHDVNDGRVFRIFEDDDGLKIRYHFGLTTNSKTPNTQTFKFFIYKHVAQHGMRDAMRKLFGIIPEAYTDYTPGEHGASVFAMDNSTTNPKEFGVSRDYRGWDSTARLPLYTAGIKLLTHPLPVEWHLGGTPLTTTAEKHSLLDNFISGMELGPSFTWTAGTGGTYTHRYATLGYTFDNERLRMKNCAIWEEDGTDDWVTFNFNTSLDFIGVWAEDLPGLSMSDGEDDFWINPQMSTAATAGADYDGLDFDNVTMLAGRGYYNYRTDHFPLTDSSIVFNSRNKQLCLLTGFGYREYIGGKWNDMHTLPVPGICEGNVSSAEYNAHIFCRYMDKLGGEAGFSGDTYLERLRHRRMNAANKCVNEIHNAGGANSNRDEIVAKGMLYGTYPAIPGLNHQNPDFASAPNRAYCQTFVPTMDAINNAGWQPIPYASTLDNGIFIERWGTIGTGDLHFVFYNHNATVQSPTITFDPASLGITGTSTWTEIWPTPAAPLVLTNTITPTIPAERSIVFTVAD